MPPGVPFFCLRTSSQWAPIMGRDRRTLAGQCPAGSLGLEPAHERSQACQSVNSFDHPGYGCHRNLVWDDSLRMPRNPFPGKPSREMSHRSELVRYHVQKNVRPQHAIIRNCSFPREQVHQGALARRPCLDAACLAQGPAETASLDSSSAKICQGLAAWRSGTCSDWRVDPGHL